MENRLPMQQRVHSWLASLREPNHLPHINEKIFSSETMLPSTPPESHASSAPRYLDDNTKHNPLNPQPRAGGDFLADLSGSPSPSKKRARRSPEAADQAIDYDKTPKVLQRRPILRATSPRKRVASPRSIKSVAHLSLLEKPVHFVSSEDVRVFQSLPPDVQDLCILIRRVHRFHQFVPGEIQPEFSALLKYRGDAAEQTWFSTPTNPMDRKQRLLEEMGALLNIQYLAQECAVLHRHEAAWNSKVHDPLLTLAFESGRNNERARDADERAAEDIRLDLVHRIRVENVTSATITGDCVPRVKDMPSPAHGEDDNRSMEDAASILAWSLSDITPSSSGSLASDAEYQPAGRHDESDPFIQGASTKQQQHSKTGSKKVNFALTVAPKEGTSLYNAIEAVLIRLRGTSSPSINPSGYLPLVKAPIAVVIESKTSISTEDPTLQLGMMAAAIHRRLHSLPVQSATGSSPLTEIGVIMVFPMIAIIDHQWEVYFACDRGKKIEMIGPIELGSTKSLIQTYMLLASLRILASWIQDSFCPALEKWLTLRVGDSVP